MTLKIALSASYWNRPEVEAVLRECDVIYTTNVAARDELYELFGKSRVKFIPCATEEMLDLIRSWHDRPYGEDAEFVTFSDLFRTCNQRSLIEGEG